LKTVQITGVLGLNARQAASHHKFTSRTRFSAPFRDTQPAGEVVPQAKGLYQASVRTIVQGTRNSIREPGLISLAVLLSTTMVAAPSRVTSSPMALADAARRKLIF
jgi:hypothetical protein